MTTANAYVYRRPHFPWGVDHLPIELFPSGAAPSYDFLDHFNDIASTSLDLHTPDTDSEGAGWTEQNGDWAIDIGGTEAEGINIAPGEPDWVATFSGISADGDMEAIVYMATASNKTNGIVFRYTDNNNFWFAGVNPFADEIRLYNRASGSWGTPDAVSVTVNTATEYTVKVSFRGSSITVYLDGVSKITKTSSVRQTEKTHGMRVGFASDPVIRDIWFDGVGTPAGSKLLTLLGVG